MVTESRSVKEESQRTPANTREIKSQGQLSSHGVHHQQGRQSQGLVECGKGWNCHLLSLTENYDTHTASKDSRKHSPRGCGHTSATQQPSIEIMLGTCFINCNRGTMSVIIIAPESRGHIQGLWKEGPQPTKSHEGSLFLLFFTYTKPQRVPDAYMEAQAHMTMPQMDIQ